MGLFGKGFGTGLAQGLAEGATRTIQTALDKREEEASAARKYMQTRRMQEAERYDADMAEASEVLEGFAQLTGGDLDKAAQLMKGAGGAEGRRTLLAELQAETRKNQDFNVLTAYNFAEAQAGEYGRDDYLRTLVRDPKSLALPQSKKIGLGLADKILGAEAKDMGISMPELRGQRIESLGTATAVPGAFSVAEEYQLQQDAAKASLDLTKAKIIEIESKGDTENALSFSTYKSSFTDQLRDSMRPLDVPIDEDGNFSLKTASEKGEAFKDAWSNTIENFAKQGVAARGTLSKDGNLQQLISKASLKMNNKYIVDVNQYTPETAPSIGSAYYLKDEKSGINMPHLYLGSSYGFVALQ